MPSALRALTILQSVLFIKLCIWAVLTLTIMSLNMISFGGQFSLGRVSMPSATITCTVCSFAMR